MYIHINKFIKYTLLCFGFSMVALYPVFASASYHPADTSANWEVGDTEILSYLASWRAGNVLDTYVLNGLAMWRAGAYHFDGTQICPGCWVVGAGGLSAGAHVWSRNIGGMNVGDVASPAAVAVDGSGSVVIVGKLTGTIDLGGGALTSAGGGDFFVAKYSASGVYLWARRAGSLADDRAGGVAVDRDGNVLVTGYFAGTIDLGGGVLTATGGNIFVAKYSAGGAHLWSESFGPTTTASGYAISNALAVDGSGNVVVGGLFAGVGDFGGGPLSGAGGSDIFVAKYTAAGGHVWSRRFGGTSTDRVNALAVDGSGNVVVGGIFMNTVDFGGGPLSSAGLYDMFIAKYTAAGGHVWSRRFGAASNDNVNGLTVDGGGNVLVTGDFTDTVDFGGGPVSSPVYSDMFIAKYTAAGEYLWSKNFGTSFVQETANGIAADANGNVVVTGSIYAALDLGGGILYPNGGKDFFVVKFSATGVHLWSKRAGDSFEDSGVCLTTDAAGNVLATGWFQNVINFGGGPLINYGASDTFLVKFAP